GDYDHTGAVDSADYVAWRSGLGSTFTQADYDVWRAHFGQMVGSGSGASGNPSIPEPATWALLTMSTIGYCSGWRPRSIDFHKLERVWIVTITHPFVDKPNAVRKLITFIGMKFRGIRAAEDAISNQGF